MPAAIAKPSERVAKYADMFSAMGTEPRLRIMQMLLSAHPDGLVVGDIQGELDIPNSTLSHHLEKVKGYTLDNGYFVVYDPYPVDWESNSLRYGDDVSMIGKNRYLPADQLFDALKTPVVIEVWSS